MSRHKKLLLLTPSRKSRKLLKFQVIWFQREPTKLEISFGRRQDNNLWYLLYVAPSVKKKNKYRIERCGFLLSTHFQNPSV